MKSAVSSLDGAACMCLCAERERSWITAEAPGTAADKHTSAHVWEVWKLTFAEKSQAIREFHRKF